MTREEKREALNNELEELARKIIAQDEAGEYDDALYEEYFRVEAQLQEMYREENEGPLLAYYEKHIKGKSFDEIDPERWDWYSDWHKDVYGYRPRRT